MALGISDVIILKNEVKKNFAVEIHMQDSCAGQVFTVKEPMSNELKTFITNFFKEKRIEVSIINDMSFSVK